MRLIYLTLLFLTLTAVCRSQEVSIDKFYYSDNEPIELNRNESEYIESLLKEYEESHGKSKYIDNREFVYEYNYYLKELNKSGKIFYDNEIVDYLNELKDFILDKEEDRKRIRIYLMDETDLNAFTNDFGNIYVHVGAIARLKTQEELLFLLAHEISHVLLAHSRSSEVSENKARKSWTYGYTYDANQFSRENEKQADINAIKLLIDKVDLTKAEGIFDHLAESANPIIDGKLDFSILTFGDVSQTHFLDSLFQTLTEFQVLSDDSDEEGKLSTHPSIDSRRKTFRARIKDIDFTEFDDALSSDFEKIRSQAGQILLRSYLYSGQFIDGLDLVCKLRKENPTDGYLVHTQMRLMVLISQDKYQEKIIDQFIGFNGSSCNDENFLRFKVLLLKLSNTDFSVVCLKSIRQGLKLFDLEEKSALIEKTVYQLLYLNNVDLFDVSDSVYKYSDEYKFENDKYDDSSNVELFEELTSRGLIYVTKFDTLFQRSFFEGKELTHSEIDFIEEVKQKDELIDKVEIADLNDDSQERGSLILRPDRAAKAYKKGIFLKSPNFDPTKKVALVESSFIYLNSINLSSYSVNFEKTIRLSEKLDELVVSDLSVSTDLSNSSKSGVSVYDNFIHGIMQRWMSEKLSGENIVYSRVEDEISELVSKSDQAFDYLAMNLCIVNKNRGGGNRNNQTFYQVYFDVHLNEVSYIAAIGSNQRITEYQLEHFLYLSNYKKAHE